MATAIFFLVAFRHKLFPHGKKYRISSTGLKELPAPKEKGIRIPLILLLVINGLFILGMSFYFDSVPTSHPKPAAPIGKVATRALPSTEAGVPLPQPLEQVMMSAPEAVSLADSLVEVASKALGAVATLIGILIGMKDLREAKKKKKASA